MTRALLEYAKNELELGKQQKDGKTLREHLQAHERSSRKRMDRLHLQPPAGTDYLWGWFSEISYGLDAVSAKDIAAWESLTGIKLKTWEVNAVRQLDISRRTRD